MGLLEMKTFERKDFASKTISILENLFVQNEYSDVTFVSEYGTQIKAHKYVLCASSPFFAKIFVELKDASSFITLQGVEYHELWLILKFIYTGVAEVSEDNVESFLETAKYLEIKGIEEHPSSAHEQSEATTDYQESDTANNFVEDADKELNCFKNFEQEMEDFEQEMKMAYINQTTKPVLENLMETVKQENYFQSDSKIRNFPCQKCTYRGTTKKMLKDHIFRKHEGGKFPCTKCPFVSSTTATRYRHELTKHKGLTFECGICDKVFADPKSLKIHNRHTHEGIRYNCDFCTYSGGTRQQLKLHVGKVHQK